MSKFGKELIESMEQAAAFVRGDATDYVTHEFNPVDVKAAREKLELSQQKFSVLIGTPVDTLRKWEQGKRHPSGAARTLIRVIEREPEAVKRALAG